MVYSCACSPSIPNRNRLLWTGKSAKKSILLINTNDLIQIEWTRTWERCQSGSAATHHPGQMREIKAGANLHIFRISAPDSAQFSLPGFPPFFSYETFANKWLRTELNQTKPNPSTSTSAPGNRVALPFCFEVDPGGMSSWAKTKQFFYKLSVASL